MFFWNLKKNIKYVFSNTGEGCVVSSAKSLHLHEQVARFVSDSWVSCFVVPQRSSVQNSDTWNFRRFSFSVSRRSLNLNPRCDRRWCVQYCWRCIWRTPLRSSESDCVARRDEIFDADSRLRHTLSNQLRVIYRRRLVVYRMRSLPTDRNGRPSCVA